MIPKKNRRLLKILSNLCISAVLINPTKPAAVYKLFTPYLQRFEKFMNDSRNFEKSLF